MIFRTPPLPSKIPTPIPARYAPNSLVKSTCVLAFWYALRRAYDNNKAGFERTSYSFSNQPLYLQLFINYILLQNDPAYGVRFPPVLLPDCRRIAASRRVGRRFRRKRRRRNILAGNVRTIGAYRFTTPCRDAGAVSVAGNASHSPASSTSTKSP